MLHGPVPLPTKANGETELEAGNIRVGRKTLAAAAEVEFPARLTVLACSTVQYVKPLCVRGLYVTWPFPAATLSMYRSTALLAFSESHAAVPRQRGLCCLERVDGRSQAQLMCTANPTLCCSANQRERCPRHWFSSGVATHARSVIRARRGQVEIPLARWCATRPCRHRRPTFRTPSLEPLLPAVSFVQLGCSSRKV